MIDWDKPLIAMPSGKPARVLDGPDNNGYRRVAADFGKGDNCYALRSDGRLWAGSISYFICNAMPDEVLAHPDVWPEWQAWAQKQSPPAHPDGVLVTREKARKVAEMLTISPATMFDALGMPPEPPKQAPWEVAYEAWARDWGGALPERGIWRAAVDWCVVELEKHTGCDVELRSRIMGKE